MPSGRSRPVADTAGVEPGWRTSDLSRLVLWTAGLGTLLVALFFGSRMVTGMVIESELQAAFDKLAEHPQIEATLVDYQRGVTRSSGRVMIRSPLFNGPVALTIQHGPSLLPTLEPVWARLEATVAPRHWLELLDLHFEGAQLKAYLPTLQLPRRIQLPELRVHTHRLVNGGYRSRVWLDDFEHEGRLGFPVLRIIGASGEFESPADSERLVIDLQVQQLMVVDQAMTRLVISGLEMSSEYQRMGDLGAPYATVTDVDRFEWSQGEAAIQLGALHAEQRLSGNGLSGDDQSGDNWKRSVSFSVAEGRIVPRDDREASISIELAGELTATGLDELMWGQFVHDLQRDRLDESIWSDMASAPINVEIKRLSLGLDGHRGGVSGSFVIDPPDEDYAMIYEKLRGDLSVGFDRELLDVLVPFEMAPYFSDLLADVDLSSVEGGEEELLERSIAMLVQEGYLNAHKGSRFSVDFKVANDELSINGQPFAAWADVSAGDY